MSGKVQRRATRWSRNSRSFDPYETRLRKLGVYSLDRWRLCWDLIETFEIITGKEHVNSSKCFQLSDVTSGLGGHSLKLFKPRCRTTIRQNIFSLRVMNEWNKLPQEVVDAPSVNTFNVVQEQAGQTLDRYGHFQLTGFTAHPHQIQVSTSMVAYWSNFRCQQGVSI